MADYIREELEEAHRAISSTVAKCEKVLPKLKTGSPQSTLLIRRLAAFNLALGLIEEKLQKKDL